MAATRTASLSALVASRISSLTSTGASLRAISFSSRVMKLGVPFLRPEPGRLPPFLPLGFLISVSTFSVGSVFMIVCLMLPKQTGTRRLRMPS